MTSTSVKRSPLVKKGSPAAHALSLAHRTDMLRAVYQRCRRRCWAVYGRDGDAMLAALLDRYEERLEALDVTAKALQQHLLMHAPAPRDGMDEAWLCENPACRAPLYGKQANTRTCSGACRAEVSRLRRAGLLPAAEGADANRCSKGGFHSWPRHPERDGTRCLKCNARAPEGVYAASSNGRMQAVG